MNWKLLKIKDSRKFPAGMQGGKKAREIFPAVPAALIDRL